MQQKLEDYLKRQLPNKRFMVEFEEELNLYRINYDAYLEQHDVEQLESHMRKLFYPTKLQFRQMEF